MIRTTALAGCALLFLLGGPAAACASGEDPAPAPAADDALTEALRAAEAARGKVADADRLAADATRARRLALLEAVRTEGALAEAFLRAGRDGDAAASETRLR
ncbi:MAG: hypothetical protein L6R43_18995, partial [Planctomycetes bacterium]|nr:hypothetical protein [Planctomycetota bacterium]